MLDEVIVIDDAVPLATQLEIERLFTSATIPWTMVAPGEENNSFSISTDKSIDYIQFVNAVYYGEFNVVSDTFPAFVPILSAIPIKIKQLLRIKANITLSNPNRPADSYGMPHTDFTQRINKLITCIYYVNDSDGDTVMFSLVGNKLLEKHRISPKRGRLVIFPGMMYHAGNCPTGNSPRAVININLLPAD